ncbi:preATP grasp domain-containing protein [Streptomyces sp. NPDC055107]
MSEPVYTSDLKQALTGDRDARFVWLCNFEVEREWALDYVGLPAPRVSNTTATVQRMEELGALLAEPADYLLLDRPLSGGYRHYIEKSGLGAPTELLTRAPAGAGGTSRAVLDSPELMDRLRTLARGGAYLMPMGNSAQEQRISEQTGLRPAVPDAGVYERVNSKIYSRRLVEELRLRAIPGFCCETVGELHRALDRDWGDNAGSVIVKDAFGVSGRGLVVVDSGRKADRLLRLIDRRARSTGDDRIHVVVESFLPKRFDLNYQFTIDRTGSTRLDFVKEALTAGGVHLGHVMPANLTAEQHATLAEAAQLLGARLYADGFFGVVGVDALLGADDLVYPVLEINARLNMSSYQGRVTELFQRPGGVALAKHYPLRLDAPVPFEEVAEALGPLADPPEDGTGLVITCFGTVNAQADSPPPFGGRLYSVLFAHDARQLTELDRRVEGTLRRFGIDERTP